jgi:predicted dehydrogenase
MSNKSRRDFLKRAAAGAFAGAAASRAIVLEAQPTPSGPVSANDRIQIGVIGAGGQGMGDTATALRVPGVEVVAAADLYDGRLARAKELWGDQLLTTRDYREVLARPDIDAVIIATPDHWHTQIAVDAMNAGKDVYVEKPMMQKLDEGHRIVEAERKTKRIVQVGSQRVSSIFYKKAKDLIAAGAIGDMILIEAFINRNTALGAWQYTIPPDASPQTVDWDRFLGRAPKRPFDATRFFRWRNYQDYGTGVAGDLFVHLLSGIHFVLGSLGPTRVMTSGGLRYWRDGRDVPDVMLSVYDYPKTNTHAAFNLFLKVNLADGGSDESSEFRFAGSEGILTIGRGVTVSRLSRSKDPGLSIGTFAKAMQDRIVAEHRAKYPETQRELRRGGEESYVPPPGYNDSFDHFTNFFDAVRTRKPVVEDAAFGLRAAGAAILSNKSYFDGRPVGWNPEAMKVEELQQGGKQSAQQRN